MSTILIDYEPATDIRHETEDVSEYIDEICATILCDGLAARKLADDIVQVSIFENSIGMSDDDRRWDFAPVYETDDEELLSLAR